MIINNVIMGSGENLDTELATQDDLLAQIRAALESKTGASGGNETSGLINFTIAGTSYQAEDGMTWAQWIESDYNIDDFVYSGNVINDMNINYAVGYDGVYCTPSDIIVHNRAYVSMPDPDE